MQLSIRRRATVLLERYGARLRRRRPPEFRLVVLTVLLFPLMGWLAGQAVLAQTSSALRASLPQQKKHNESALMILGGYPGTTYSGLAHDIAAALGGRDGLRLLAVDAAGGTESLRDLLLLRGIDLALVPANTLVYTNDAATFGPGLQERLTYITLLYGEEVHILVGPGTDSIENLRGRKIAVPPEDGNTEFAVQDLLRRLRIKADVVRVAAPDAIDEVRSGTFAALVLMGGKPLRFVAGLPKDGSLRLLALPPNQALGDGYSPADFRADDYPALIPGGRTIDTVSVSTVLVTNNTAKSDESNRRITRFVPAFFGALSDLAGPQWHPKWREVNFAATLTGWSRFAAAREWLDRTTQEQSASVQKAFEAFLRANSPPGSPAMSPRERRQLFEEFVKWTRDSTGTPYQAVRP
jgi:TRAP-type uncharacterized transport system substrate-binding protein